MDTDETGTARTTETTARIVGCLTRDEKVELLSGADFSHITGLPDHGLPSVMLTDGPHGLRRQAGSADHVGLGDSVPATCFPTASALGSTWDPTSSSRSAGPSGARAVPRRSACSWGPD